MSGTLKEDIREIVNRGTKACDTKDVESLLDLFHPDMVWAWPSTGYDHNPETWVLDFGRFDRKRWRANWQDLFDSHDLVHNNRETKQIKVSDHQDGGLAVVDIDTLWRHHDTGEDSHWKGRTPKIYALVGNEWKLTAHWGALRFDENGVPITGEGPDPE